MNSARFQIAPRKYRDSTGNVYGVEQALRNKRFIVVRVNAGGNRKGCPDFPASGHRDTLQKLLDTGAVERKWTEVAG